MHDILVTVLVYGGLGTLLGATGGALMTLACIAFTNWRKKLTAQRLS